MLRPILQWPCSIPHHALRHPFCCLPSRDLLLLWNHPIHHHHCREGRNSLFRNIQHSRCHVVVYLLAYNFIGSLNQVFSLVFTVIILLASLLAVPLYCLVKSWSLVGFEADMEWQQPLLEEGNWVDSGGEKGHYWKNESGSFCYCRGSDDVGGKDQRHGVGGGEAMTIVQEFFWGGKNK